MRAGVSTEKNGFSLNTTRLRSHKYSYTGDSHENGQVKSKRVHPVCFNSSASPLRAHEQKPTVPPPCERRRATPGGMRRGPSRLSYAQGQRHAHRRRKVIAPEADQLVRPAIVSRCSKADRLAHLRVTTRDSKSASHEATSGWNVAGSPDVPCIDRPAR